MPNQIRTFSQNSSKTSLRAGEVITRIVSRIRKATAKKAIGASAELMFVLGREDQDPDPSRRSIRCRRDCRGP